MDFILELIYLVLYIFNDDFSKDFLKRKKVFKNWSDKSLRLLAVILTLFATWFVIIIGFHIFNFINH